MNIERIISMIINMVMRRGINMGIKKGMDTLSRRGNNKPGQNENPEAPAGLEADKKAAMRLNRRINQ